MNIFASLLLVLWILFPGKSVANELSCSELRSAIGMIRANSIGALNEYRSTAGDSYRAHIIYSFKYFEVMKDDIYAANKIFNELPNNDQQYAVWSTMGDSFCQSEKVTDMKLMDRFGASLPLRLSQAVIAHPNGMQKYIKFSFDAAQDPHSSLLFGMEHVCHVRHDEFKKAVDNLPPRDKTWFINHVMQIDNCHPMTLPESD